MTAVRPASVTRVASLSGVSSVDDSADEDALWIGSTFGARFVIQGLLGRGGMGTVYRATQLSLDRDVALKVMRLRTGRSTDGLERFAREARVAALLKHPGAVEIFDFGVADGTPFLAMELLEGTSLRAVVNEHAPLLAPDHALTIARAVADVLVAAHAIGLVHRDLKPENVFLEATARGEVVRVLDFGLAFVAGDGGELGRFTREGIVTGTPDYLSPEQARGVEVGPPSDIYSLGIFLFELMTGATPFYGDVGAILAQHMFLDAPSLRGLRPDLELAGSLDALLQRMLAKGPSERPGAPEVLDALDHLLRRQAPRTGPGAEGRAARMLSLPPDALTEAPAEERSRGAVTVAIVGELPRDLEVALAAGGLDVVEARGGAIPGGAHVVLALGASPGEVEALVRRGVPVVATYAERSIEALTALVRAGAAEVVGPPLSGAVVARKLWRALGRAPDGAANRVVST